MNSSIIKAQNQVLKALCGKIDDFYLTGGTALSVVYFQHRLSDDLDFFTQEFSRERVREIVGILVQAMKKEVSLLNQSTSKKALQLMIYSMKLGKGESLKIDFVQDVLPLLKPTKTIEGIKVLSLEDIYLRKIYAVSGAPSMLDEVGRGKAIGGRQEAKDLFDLYFLSHTFIRLSAFVNKYCKQLMREGLIRWFRTFDRMHMKADLAYIKTDKRIEFRDIDKHITKEIDKILEEELDL